MRAPRVLHQLVERYRAQRDLFRRRTYKEAELRREFVDPLLVALGWDVGNVTGKPESLKEVVVEQTLNNEGEISFFDYSLRVAGEPALIVETKSPHVDLRNDPGPAYQLRSYGWSRKLPVSILTDFEEFAVYDTRVYPRYGDDARKARVEYLTFEQYEDRWDYLTGLFSREAVEAGSLNALVKTLASQPGSIPVDEKFLGDIERWRLALAKAIQSANSLELPELNYAVQQIIDRIIFLRICEDRGIEPRGQLQTLVKGPGVYARLVGHFRNADNKYNSGLFHFRSEKGRGEAPDQLTPALQIQDKVLRDVIADLYRPKSAYSFAAMPADILGQVYERFLGKTITISTTGRVRIDPKPEVRKAGGVYYTPTYVVNYIVHQSLGELLSRKKPKDIVSLRVVDPSCGSGSFLIQAYQYLLDWYLDYYMQDGPHKYAKRNPPVLRRRAGESWRLTTQERKRILTAHVFGVDIDNQAVEVTKLSLLLKVLENETDESLSAQLQLLEERALPDLSDNIKCGNSLIAPNYYEGKQLTLLGSEEEEKINAFSWADEFGGAMSQGGFDAVIGNPPWGASFDSGELAYLRREYDRVIERMVDSYIYFIDKALRVAKPRAPVSFIIPSTLLNQTDATKARDLLLQRGLKAVVNLGKDIFTTKVLNTSTVFVSVPRAAGAKMIVADLSRLPLDKRRRVLPWEPNADWVQWLGNVKSDPHKTFFVGDGSGPRLLRRLRAAHGTLADSIDGSIERGVTPDVVAASVLTPADAKQWKVEKELLRPSISGGQIKRYRDWESDRYILYVTRDTPIKQFPNALAYLKQFKDAITCPEVREGRHPWYALHRPRKAAIFERSKIIGLTTSRTIELLHDPSDSLFVTDAMYVLAPMAQVHPWAMMAIMQSKLFLYLYRVSNQGESRVIPQVKASKLSALPFPKLQGNDAVQAQLVEAASSLQDRYRKLAAAKTPPAVTAAQRAVGQVESQLEAIVEACYGLRPDEAESYREEMASF